ncbi:rho guanine nucleotide exchange factor 5 [Varanus komodoensis]|uniref:Rho guanine nucleotide exchange factor 5 n=1 Tax=Varanus komodoensis TaxID=61221 RepID=A0A8D2JCW5_VARKO|nr:rho guanine nucleotide exchange factor 5 [Varanus komodoensis]
MESKEIKRGDPFLSTTHIFSEASNTTPARRYHDVTELSTMSKAPEEGMVEEKEGMSCSQDLTLLFIKEEQIQGRLSNPMERETGVEPQRGRSDPENYAGLSEREIAFNIQEVNLENRKVLCLNCHHEELADSDPLNCNQSSFFNTSTLAQVPSPQGEVEALAGFSQALKPCDSYPQTHYIETVRTDTFPVYDCPSMTHGITGCHQTAASPARSDEDHSWELQVQHEIDKGLLKGTEVTKETYEEMASKMERAGLIQFSSSTKDEEEVREIKGQREDVNSSVPYQPTSECSENKIVNLGVTQTKPNGILSLLSSKKAKHHSGTQKEVEEMEQNAFLDTILHLKEKEEDGTSESTTHSQKEKNQLNYAKTHTDCSEAEADQKETSEIMEAEMELLELKDAQKNENEVWIRMETNMKTKHEKLELEYNVQEEQELDMQVAGAGKRKLTSLPVTLCLDTLSNMENNWALLSLNKASSLAEAEGFAFSSKELLSPGHYPQSVCELPKPYGQTAAMVFTTPPEDMHPMNESPRTECPMSLNSYQSEYTDICHPAGCISDIGQESERTAEEDRIHSIEEEDNENSGDEKYVRSDNSEEIAPSCQELVVSPDHHDLHDSQLSDHPVKVAIHSPTSPLGTTIAVGPLHASAGKGTSCDIVLCELADSIQKPPNQNPPTSCQLPCEEASVLDSVGHVQTSRKSKGFHEDTQSSASKILQSISSGEYQSSSAKGNVELSRVSFLTTCNPASLQAQDTTIHYLDKSQQYLSPPVQSFVFPEKEIGTETLCMEREISVSESPCFSILEEDKAECDHNIENLPTPDICSVIVTDVAQLTKPLTPVPFSNQTPASEPASSHFSQLFSLAADSKPSQSLTSPPKAHASTQPAAQTLDPRHLLEQPPSSSQILTLKSTYVTSPPPLAPTLVTELLDQSPFSECDLNQHDQLPVSVLSSDQSVSLEYEANQPMLMPIVFGHSVFPEHTSQSNQLINKSQIREPAAPDLNNSLLTELLVFASNRDNHNPASASISSQPSSPDGNFSAFQSAEIPATSLPIFCTGGNDWIDGSVPIADFISDSTPSVLQYKNLVPNVDNRREEFSVAKLAKSEGAGVPQDQKDWNIQEVWNNLEVSLLGRHSDLISLGNEASEANPMYSLPETMPNVMGMHDEKSSDHISFPSVKSQKMCESTESTNSSQSLPFLAFTNPIHFLQLGPPSPPTTMQESGNAKETEPSVLMWQVAETTEKFEIGLEKSVMEQSPALAQRKDRVTKHPPLEKSSSCPDKNVVGLDTKGLAYNSKKQEMLIKHRAKSKDWHRHGIRKISIPTDNALEVLASLVPSKETTSAHKDKSDHLDLVKYEEKKPAEEVENIKRRHSKLINSSRLLYQEYSDVALNKAIQSQKRADSLSEEVELGSPSSPRLRRKVLSPQDSYLQRLSVSSSTSLWQDIPMVRGSTMLLSMTREEQKLQEAKFELIASEASYLRSLNVAVDHFQHSQELQAVLTNQDKQWLFSRLQDVHDVSANFLFDLEEKLEENMFTFNVCDVTLRHAPEFRRVYLPYVTNQTYQEQTFQRLLNGVPAFQQVLERLESDPVCQRLSLKSFLILPFQRITRLKLLLQNILKKTQPGTDEEVQATQAYDALEKLIKDCNENVQRMKSTEELIHLSQNMEFECKIFPLISQSRRLVKSGELTALEYNMSLKWKLTTRPIYLHLFNDYLLLSRPRENGRFIVFDYAASSDVRGEKCEMKLHGANKNVFRLFLLQNNQGKKVEFLFRTETQSEKLRWISALMPPQTEPDLLGDPDAPQVQCVRSYKARENDELALEKADIIMVLWQTSDGWIEGVKLSDGERGWFPSEQVEFISSKHVRQMNLKEEQRVKNAKQHVFRRK